MPKDLFFTLSQEKQSRIIEAAIGEFSEVIYHDASINQIIKNAEISRGSFYQYFDDKEDLYFYILENIIDSTAYSFVQKYVENNPIDSFSIYRGLLICNLKMLSDEKYKGFFANLFLSINYQFQERMKGISIKKKMNILSNNAGIMAGKSEQDRKCFTELINILELINRDLLMTKITKSLRDKDILEIFDLRISIIKGQLP